MRDALIDNNINFFSQELAGTMNSAQSLRSRRVEPARVVAAKDPIVVIKRNGRDIDELF